MILLSACTSSTPPSEDSGGDSGGGGKADSGATGGVTTWKAAPDWTFGEIAAVSTGNQGAIAYVESGVEDTGGVTHSVVKLQRLDATGVALGASIELGTTTSSARPTLTLATNGSRYLACWDNQSESQISCALAPVGAGPALPALSVAGAWPSLAYRSGAWTLAYGVPGHVAVARVAEDGSGLGIPAMIGVDAGTSPRALLAATPAGFSLVSAPDFDSGQNVRVHLLDSVSYLPIGLPIDLGMKLWLLDAVALAVNGSTLAVSVSKPYGSSLFVVENGVISHTHEVAGGGKVGPVVALTAVDADGASFGRLSLDSSPEALTYSTIQGAELSPMPQELEAERSLVFFYNAFALLEIDGKVLLAATEGQESDEIIVAPVQRP
jgi:hypothetical protein